MASRSNNTGYSHHSLRLQTFDDKVVFMPSDVVVAFVGALQASVSVLLTIFYGTVAAQYRLLDEASTAQISSLCIKFLLPALLITNVGSEVQLSTAHRYVPVLVWSIFYNVVSLGLGIAATRWMKLPSWVTPAVTFNNATSWPLLLIETLETAGVLSVLLPDGDSSSDAVARAQSYLLVGAIIGNSLAFAIGPWLLKMGYDGDGNSQQKNDDDADGDTRHDEGDHEDDEQTSLLPDRLRQNLDNAERTVNHTAGQAVHRLPQWLQGLVDFLYQFLNAPTLGALAGAVLGLVPPLHRAFFAETQACGIFNAWLTSSVENIGDLFTALQTVIVGVYMSQSLRKWKQGEESGQVPWRALAFILFVRYVLWSVISILVIWALASKTTLLTNDPILWFSLMLMPTGPPALKIQNLADVENMTQRDKMSIAKLLTITHIVSPIISVTVIGSLQACKNAVAS